jgi:hypothetical protein
VAGHGPPGNTFSASSAGFGRMSYSAVRPLAVIESYLRCLPPPTSVSADSRPLGLQPLRQRPPRSWPESMAVPGKRFHHAEAEDPRLRRVVHDVRAGERQQDVAYRFRLRNRQPISLIPVNCRVLSLCQHARKRSPGRRCLWPPAPRATQRDLHKSSSGECK